MIRGAGSTKRVHKIRPASLDEIEAITAALPEQYRAMVLLAAWCALRFGELTELRRRDLHLGDAPARCTSSAPSCAWKNVSRWRPQV